MKIRIISLFLECFPLKRRSRRGKKDTKPRKIRITLIYFQTHDHINNRHSLDGITLTLASLKVVFFF